MGAPPGGGTDVLALVAARDEADRIGATVTALRSVPAVRRVIVVDDGSRDDTTSRALEAGATVLRGGPVGKGDALEAALSHGGPARVYLLVDGDLGRSAAGVAPLLEEILSGRADLAVGVLPPPPTGGFGVVKTFAARLVERIAGSRPSEPLSGQRAVTRECLWACRPLAGGFGLETAMTADALRMGFRIAEIPVRLEHRFTRKDVAGFVHRARQGVHIVRAIVPRMAGVR